MLDVERSDQCGIALLPPEMARMATKLSPVLLQKHSLGGCP